MTAPLTLDAATARSETRSPPSKLIGLVLVAFAPALFWTAMLALISDAIGMAVSSGALIVTGSAIALFLTVIYAAMTTVSDTE